MGSHFLSMQRVDPSLRRHLAQMVAVTLHRQRKRERQLEAEVVALRAAIDENTKTRYIAFCTECDSVLVSGKHWPVYPMRWACDVTLCHNEDCFNAAGTPCPHCTHELCANCARLGRTGARKSKPVTMAEGPPTPQPQPQPQRQLNFMALARFFCEQFRVSDVWKINPRQGKIEAWTLMGAPRTLGVEVGSVHRDGQEIPKFRFAVGADPEAQRISCPLVAQSPLCRFLGAGPQGDTEHICLFNVITRGTWSSMPMEMAVRFPFYPIADGGQREALDRLMGEAGAVAGAYMKFASTPKTGRDVEAVAVAEQPHHGFLNRFAAATLALVTERNLRNGIVPIPFDVCVAAGLPVFRGPPPPPSDWPSDVTTWNERWLRAMEGQHKIQCFYAVPVNHVLAWALRDEQFAAYKRLPSLRFQFVPPPHAGMGTEPVTLYFLVADLHMQALEQEFRFAWLGKADMRPLSALRFDLVPILGDGLDAKVPPGVDAVEGVAMIRSYLTYLAPEPGLTEETIAQLIPTLSPGFPEPGGWIPYNAEEMTAIDMLAQRQAASVGKKK